jgi:hypothetical protein
VHFARLLSSLVISQRSSTTSARRRRSVKKQQHSLFTPHMTKLKSRDVFAARRRQNRCPESPEESVSSSGVFTPQGAFPVWCVSGASCTSENFTESTLQEDAPVIMEAELKLASGGRLPPFPHLVRDVRVPLPNFSIQQIFYLVLDARGTWWHMRRGKG